VQVSRHMHEPQAFGEMSEQMNLISSLLFPRESALATFNR